MILWEKQASAAWLAAHGSALELIAAGDLAIISRPGKVRSLVQIVCHRTTQATRLRRDFGGIARPLPRDWLRKSQAAIRRRRIRVGRRLEVASDEKQFSKSAQTARLLIPAAGAFGTGEHATTALSLRLLEEATRRFSRGWRLLDAGTGTGILALAARRLGAGEVLGIDNDPRAVGHARQNARLNRVSRATFCSAEILKWKPAASFEVITANLFSELLIAALPIFKRALHPRGHLIVSGILREQAPAVLRALERAGFPLERQRRGGKWVALHCSGGS
jgi:ribosomal protein L11 methyltransferase